MLQAFANSTTTHAKGRGRGPRSTGSGLGSSSNCTRGHTSPIPNKTSPARAHTSRAAETTGERKACAHHKLAQMRQMRWPRAATALRTGSSRRGRVVYRRPSVNRGLCADRRACSETKLQGTYVLHANASNGDRSRYSPLAVGT